MYISPRIFAAATIVAVVGFFTGCGENPASTTATSTDARMNGGATFGSGGGTSGSGGDVQTTTAADTSSADGRSGVGFGSGN